MRKLDDFMARNLLLQIGRFYPVGTELPQYKVAIENMFQQQIIDPRNQRFDVIKNLP